MGAYRDLAPIRTHAEAGRGFARGSKTIRIAIGLGGDRLMVAVLMGMVAMMRIAVDQAAMLMVVRVVMMVTTSTTARVADAMHTVHGALRVATRAFCAADCGRHGRRIAVLLPVMMMVCGAGRR